MDKIEDFLEQVQKGQMNAIDISRRVLADGKEQVDFRMENRPATPERRESPPRAHIFHDAESFCRYVTANVSESGAVMVDMINHSATAVLDQNAPLGFELVCLWPANDPSFEMLQETMLDQSPMDIWDFARALMRNRNILAGRKEQAMQLALLMQQIQISEKVLVKAGTGKKNINGVMSYSEVKAGYADEGTLIDIPDAVAVITPIYLHTAPVEFDLILTITNYQGRGVVVNIDAPELKVRRTQIFERLLAVISTSVKCYVGCAQLKFGYWEYVR